jgi:hypothetical protein
MSLTCIGVCILNEDIWHFLPHIQAQNTEHPYTLVVVREHALRKNKLTILVKHQKQGQVHMQGSHLHLQ